MEVVQGTNYRNLRVEFLLEEPSMMNFLEIILPEILPIDMVLGVNCFLRPHQGKQDLKKSIPRKVRVFSNYHMPTKIVVVHDQDSNDCIQLKSELTAICNANGDCPVLIRIACRELENWYLGDMKAISQVYPGFKPKTHRYKSKFRIVDNTFGSVELEAMIPSFQKSYASRNIPHYIELDKNKSVSFQHFKNGLVKFLDT